MPSRRDLHVRLATHYLTILQEVGILYEGGGEGIEYGLALFDEEWPQIQAQQAWVASQVDAENVVTTLCNAYPDAAPSVLILRQPPQERLRWLKTAVRAARHLRDRDAEATHLGNLGTVYQTRGDLKPAEAMYRRSLALFEALGHKEGMASTYGNLGVVYRIRGDLPQAEAMYRRSLVLYEALGHKEGMADQYGNLGVVYRIRGDLPQAEAMYRQSLVLYEALDHKEGMASIYGNLGTVYQTRGDLLQAEAMYRQGLVLEEALGRKAGMADQYGNLGILYGIRGDLPQAEAMYRQSLALFLEIGARPQVEQLQQWLRALRRFSWIAWGLSIPRAIKRVGTHLLAWRVGRL